MKISIIGQDVVDSKIYQQGLKHIDNLSYYNMFHLDASMKDIVNTSAVCICIPNYNINQRQALVCVDSTVSMLSRANYKGTISVKGPVPLDTINKLSEKYTNLKFCLFSIFLELASATLNLNCQFLEQCIDHNTDRSVSELKKYFKFDQFFHLINYDRDMSLLYREIKQLQKETYEPNYRFIFTHYDTDYHITNDQPGLTLINLQRLLKSLDISNYFCLILSNKVIQNQLDILRTQETTDEHSISSICAWVYSVLHPYVGPVDQNIDLISKKYICLNGMARFHRRLLYSLLHSKNLLDHGIVSYNNLPADQEQIILSPSLQASDLTSEIPMDLRFLYTDKFTRFRDSWNIHDPSIHKILSLTPTDSYKNFNDTHNHTDFQVNLSQQAFLSVITETCFDCPSFQLSEKSIKPIVSKRPFLIVSSAGSLKLLKEAGFKTFDRWWSEDYDTIIDPTERLKRIVEIINDISMKSINELKSMYLEMQEVIEYNFNYHQSMSFYHNEILKLNHNCQANLGYR